MVKSLQEYANMPPGFLEKLKKTQDVMSTATVAAEMRQAGIPQDIIDSKLDIKRNNPSIEQRYSSYLGSVLETYPPESAEYKAAFRQMQLMSTGTKLPWEVAMQKQEVQTQLGEAEAIWGGNKAARDDRDARVAAGNLAVSQGNLSQRKQEFMSKEEWDKYKATIAELDKQEAHEKEAQDFINKVQTDTIRDDAFAKDIAKALFDRKSGEALQALLGMQNKEGQLDPDLFRAKVIKFRQKERAKRGERPPIPGSPPVGASAGVQAPAGVPYEETSVAYPSVNTNVQSVPVRTTPTRTFTKEELAELYKGY
jgi:hypothetical protein